MELTNLPFINACMNFCSTLCLISGFIFIKNKNEDAHKKSMMLALVFSTLFLIGYLIYHANVPSTVFPELGIIKTIYLSILIPHIILAALMLPLIFTVVYFAIKKNFIKHKKWAKFTFPIWTFVSISGVVIYLMVYVFFKGQSA